MSRILKWATPIVAFGLILGLMHTRVIAEDTKTEKDTGTVKGIVKDKDDKPVAGATIRIMAPGGKHAEGEHKPKQEAAGEKGPKAPPVATGTSDNDGKFSIADVPVGKYVVAAGMKGIGTARENVEVKKGETAEVNLKLAMKGEKSGGGAAPKEGGEKKEGDAK